MRAYINQIVTSCHFVRVIEQVLGVTVSFRVYDPVAHINPEQRHLKSIILSYDLGDIFNYMPGGFDVDFISFATLNIKVLA